MEDVKGRTAFITGGARGIGLGIAGAFARAGMKLAIADIDPDSLAAAKSELAKLTAVETFNLDVRDREAYARVADEAEARLGPSQSCATTPAWRLRPVLPTNFGIGCWESI